MNKTIYLLSDELADPLVKIVQSGLRAFPHSAPNLVIRSFISEQELSQRLKEGLEDSLVYYSFVQPGMRALMETACTQVRCIDLFKAVSTPLAAYLEQALCDTPSVNRLDADYYARMEAIEFSVRYDDGKDTRGIKLADIVLLGISRTSKTPLSMYLAGMSYKCANIPLYPEVELPSELFEVDAHKIVGLTHDIDELIRIRTERLKQMGYADNNRYADIERIALEQQYAQSVFKRLGCTVINVSGAAVEESAARIIRTMRQARTHDSETN